jgi:transposase
MTATIKHCTPAKQALYVAFELGWSEWKLAFSTSIHQPPRLRSLGARDLRGLEKDIADAKSRLKLPADTPVFSCYEAGRDGFWLHRYLTEAGVENLVVDAASIEVNRRKRRAKSDRLDAGKLLTMLLRYHGGEKRVWSVVQVPKVANEDARQLHRELETLKGERTEHVNRIKGLLASQGLKAEVGWAFAELLQRLRLWDGSAVPAELQQRLLREHRRWELTCEQIDELEKKRLQEVCSSATAEVEQVRRLFGLRGIGINSAWLFVREFFSWRQFVNRRQVGALAGLTPTPYQSGDSDHEQGISKSGNRWLRTMAIEIAWCWLHYQPQSKLSRWYQRRFGKGARRQKRIGIVAVARKLLVALWRYLVSGEVPEGAREVGWESKVPKKMLLAGGR